LSDGAGIYDVCEKEPTDAMDYLTAQQREDITASAQVQLVDSALVEDDKQTNVISEHRA